MKAKIIRGNELETIERGTNKITSIFDTEEYSGLNIVKIKKVGGDIKIGLDPESDVFYYVLDGEGISYLDGTEYKVKKGDLIFSPKGTKYRNQKGLTLLAISTPRYDPSKRIYDE